MASIEMCNSSLSVRLKNVEQEINEITSFMSLQDSTTGLSVTRSMTDTGTVTTSASAKSSCKSSASSSSASSSSALKQPRRLMPPSVKIGGLGGGGEGGVSRNLNSGDSSCSSRSDTRLKHGYSVSRSSSDNLSGSPTNSFASNIGVGVIGDSQQEPTRSIDIPSPEQIGDNLNINLGIVKGAPSYDSLQTFLHNINNSIIKGNQAVMSKITEGCYQFSEVNATKSMSAPSSSHGKVLANIHPVVKYQELIKEVEEEREKRIKKEIILDNLTEEMVILKEDIKKHKEMCRKYSELSEHLEKENIKQAEMLKTTERSNDEKEMELEMYKQKYESVVRDMKMEQEHGWVLERDLQQLKDSLDQSQLKIQELLGARTMAVELAHDLQKKHQSYVVEHQYEWQEMKNRNTDLEKLLNESIHEKDCLVERLQTLEKVSEKCKKMETELNEYKKSLADAEKTVCELTRNPEGIPRVRSLLNTQEQTFKTALNEKATSEMALQAKYTTLEVELQIIQEEFSKRLDNLQEEKNMMIREAEQKISKQTAEIEKLKLVTKELTELSNQYKSKITELSDINKHQEVLIKCQNEAISSKEERVKLSNQEAELNVRRVEQEKKALMLEHEKTINNLKKSLDEERDKLLVKDKIADDQTETIMQLRQNLTDKGKEVQRKSKEVQRLEQQLKQERLEKDNLNCDVQHLKMHRARMNETITELQKQVELLKGNNVHKKHTHMLEELEKKVAMKQAEWESEISRLTTERDQARETAQYAIENLSSAMEEYQKEMSNQKSLQTNLAGLIREKEEQLNAAENRVKALETEKDCLYYTTSYNDGGGPRYYPRDQPERDNMNTNRPVTINNGEIFYSY